MFTYWANQRHPENLKAKSRWTKEAMVKEIEDWEIENGRALAFNPRELTKADIFKRFFYHDADMQTITGTFVELYALHDETMEHMTMEDAEAVEAIKQLRKDEIEKKRERKRQRVVAALRFSEENGYDVFSAVHYAKHHPVEYSERISRNGNPVWCMTIDGKEYEIVSPKRGTTCPPIYRFGEKTITQILKELGRNQ